MEETCRIRATAARRIAPRFALARTIGFVLGLGLFAVRPSASPADEAPPASAGGPLRAGAAAVDVSPWTGVSINGGMHDQRVAFVRDPLRARALVLDDGATRLAFVVADSCMIPRAICDEAKRLAHAATGIPPERVSISATHTHSAPAVASVFQSDADPEYATFLTRRLADAIAFANARLVPAEIAIGSADVPEHVFNRRWRMKEGTVPPGPFGEGAADLVKMNPTRADPNLTDPAGPTDPTVSFVAVRRPDGRPVALLANYSLHYVGGVGPGHASADYFGEFARRVEAALGSDDPGSPFVAILSNGASGDINNVDFRRPPEPREAYEQVGVVAGRVAEATLDALAKAEWRGAAELGAAGEELELAIRKPDAAELARARAILEAAGDGPLRTLEEIYARETTLIAEFPDRERLRVQAFRVGDLAVVQIPCEVFVEIGLGLRARSPFPRTFAISLANGYSGYLPTREHHALGGYETWRARSSRLEVGAADAVVAAAERALAALAGDAATAP